MCLLTYCINPTLLHPIKNEDESASLVIEATAEMLISQVVEAKFYKQFILYQAKIQKVSP